MSETLKNQKEHILKLLKEKSVMKQDVFRNTVASFEMVKKCVDEIAKELNAETQAIDKRIVVSTLETTSHATQLKVAGDMLEFFMHTNVFEFEKSHAMYRTGYVKQNEYNSYCGIINVYNFLADSFKFNRLNDLGYLVCRIFINREMKFFIEARGPIGVKYSSFSDAPLNQEKLHEIINMETGGNDIRIYKYDRIIKKYTTPPNINDDKTTDILSLNMVIPENNIDLFGYNKNHPFKNLVIHHGIQIIPFKFYTKDHNLMEYEKVFRDNKTSFIPISRLIQYMNEKDE
jgi:hypothetical protein